MQKHQRLPLIQRLIFAIPLFGWMLKDVTYGERDNIYYFIFSLVCMWVLSGMIFGYPGVIIPALMLVPTVFVFLILITQG